MSQTMFSKEESPLLDTAISKLYPRVFFHPVWVRFGMKEEVSPETIKTLFIEAEDLKLSNPSDACQILSICAVFQHYSGQTKNALTTLHMAQETAKRTGCEWEIPWVLWGVCAICFQQKRYEQAAEHLTILKHMLSNQDEWILAGFVDVVKQAMLQQTTKDNAKQSDDQSNRPLGSLLAHTFRLLNFWGRSTQTIDLDFYPPNNKDPDSTRLRSLFSLQGWKGLQLLFRGEVKVNWLNFNSRREKRHSLFWRFIFNLLHVNIGAEEVESGTIVPDSPVMEIVDSGMPVVQPLIIKEESEHNADIPISVYMLGNFNITIQERPVTLPSSRSLSLLKYLMLNHKQKNPREVLMDAFWPDVSPTKARNNLNVAMNGIRQALRTITDHPILIFKDNAYCLAPCIQFWLDLDDFESLVSSGKRSDSQNRLSAAISDYEAAISLYRGDFLEENPYEGWAVLPRERLRLSYLVTLDRLSQIYYRREQYAMCISLSQLILNRDRCREDAHSMLMRCYSRQGQDHMAVRQYQACVEALQMELDVSPAPETTRLYEQIRQHRFV